MSRLSYCGVVPFYSGVEGFVLVHVAQEGTISEMQALHPALRPQRGLGSPAQRGDGSRGRQEVDEACAKDLTAQDEARAHRERRDRRDQLQEAQDSHEA